MKGGRDGGREGEVADDAMLNETNVIAVCLRNITF